MGMIGNIARVSIREIEEIRGDSGRVFELLVGKTETIEVPSKSLIKRLFGKSDILYKSIDTGIPSDRIFDFDKSWAGIHYLLTGTEFAGEYPLNFIAAGGETPSDQDVGYGPARLFEKQDILAIKKALEQVTKDSISKNFDSFKMTNLNIYPEIWEREKEDSLNWLLDYFAEMKKFIMETNKDEFGFLIYIQ